MKKRIILVIIFLFIILSFSSFYENIKSNLGTTMLTETFNKETREYTSQLKLEIDGIKKVYDVNVFLIYPSGITEFVKVNTVNGTYQIEKYTKIISDQDMELFKSSRPEYYVAWNDGRRKYIDYPYYNMKLNPMILEIP